MTVVVRDKYDNVIILNIFIAENKYNNYDQR